MFKHWPKIPRLENEIYHVTEKIDGTNGCIIIQRYFDSGPPKPLPNPPITKPLYVYDWMDESPIKEGLGVWAQSRNGLITPERDNFGFAKWVQDNAEQLIEDLGEGYHFGEWWGQGIRRGYGLDHKRFSLFNPTKQSEVCYNVPLLTTFENILPDKEDIQLLLQNGSVAAPGFMKPEGAVVYAEKAKCYWKIILDK